MPQITETILNLKEEIERFAASRNHDHDERYLRIEGDNGTKAYAPFKHDWGTNENVDHGVAGSSKFGHVKLSNDTTGDQHTAITPQGVINYVTTSIQNLYNTINNEYTTENTGVIAQAISEYNIESKLKRFTIAIPYQIPNEYQTDDKDHILEQKIQDDMGVDYYVISGHYYLTPRENIQDNFKISYGTQQKHYARGLLDVRQSGNILIQELYTTDKDVSGDYIITGEKYTRKGIKQGSNVTWEPWLLAYMPYSESAIRIDTVATGINNMSLKETTAGYIIEWENQNSYTIEENSGVPLKIAEFSKELHTNSENHIFASYLGGFEIKITKTGIFLTSNRQKGASIDLQYLNQTYFVPRAG